MPKPSANGVYVDACAQEMDCCSVTDRVCGDSFLLQGRLFLACSEGITLNERADSKARNRLLPPI